jgi:hypothetical protein
VSDVLVVAATALFSVIAVFVVIHFARLATRPHLPGRVFESAEHFLAELGRELGLRGEFRENPNPIGDQELPGLWNGRFSGKLADGREATVVWQEFYFKSGKVMAGHRRFDAILTVEAKEAPTLEVTQESWTWLGKWFEAPRERPPVRLDEQFLAAAADPAQAALRIEQRFVVAAEGNPARDALEKKALRRAIAEAFDVFGVSELAFGNGAVRATVNAAILRHDQYRPLLDHLATVARSFETIPLTVLRFGLVRRALTTASGKPRCSYCHGDVTGAEPDLVACEKCRTVLHEGCFQELGHCPVLGCGGKTPERARVG